MPDEGGDHCGDTKEGENCDGAGENDPCVIEEPCIGEEADEEDAEGEAAGDEEGGERGFSEDVYGAGGDGLRWRTDAIAPVGLVSQLFYTGKPDVVIADVGTFEEEFVVADPLDGPSLRIGGGGNFVVNGFAGGACYIDDHAEVTRWVGFRLVNGSGDGHRAIR
jgi:hypothetical protein